MAGLLRRVLEHDAVAGNSRNIENQIDVALLNGEAANAQEPLIDAAVRAHAVSGPLDTEYQYHRRTRAGTQPLLAWAEVASRSYAAQRRPDDADRVTETLGRAGLEETTEVRANRVLARGLAGDLGSAEKLWGGLDAAPALHRSLVSSYLHNGRLDDALHVIGQIAARGPAPELLSQLYSAIVSHLAARGQVEEASVVADEATDANIALDDESATSLRAATAAQAVKEGKDVPLAVPDSLQLLSTVLGMILHEISQPMVRIEANVEHARYLLRNNDQAGARDVLEARLAPAVEALQRRLDVYRAISRERLRDTSKTAKCTVGEVLVELRDMTRIQVEEAGVIVIESVAPGLEDANLEVDPFILAFGLRQLVGNAIQALRAEGVKQPRIDVEVAPRAALGNDHRQASIVFVVADNGPGIPPDRLAQTVTLGFTTKGSGGMGMGLTLAQSVAVHYGGELTIGAASQGARLVVRVPVRSEQEPRSAQPVEENL